MSKPSQFTGDKHAAMRSPLAAAERRLIDTWAPRFPSWIHSHQLTLMTLPWSAGIVLAGWLARTDVRWLWLSSLMIFLQWFTDSFDGTLGKLRGAGLRRWGYFMDHLLDYLFMACLISHYALLAPDPHRALFFILALLYGAFEANSWLEYGATGEFRITFAGIGPTEIRLLFIALNTLIVFTGIGWVVSALPWLLAALALLLCQIVYATQKNIWALDMQEKATAAQHD